MGNYKSDFKQQTVLCPDTYNWVDFRHDDNQFYNKITYQLWEPLSVLPIIDDVSFEIDDPELKYEMMCFYLLENMTFVRKLTGEILKLKDFGESFIERVLEKIRIGHLAEYLGRSI